MNELIPDGMSVAAMWAALVGIVSPPLLNLIVNALWSSRTKTLVSLGWAVIVGTVTSLVTGTFEGLGIPAAIIAALLASATAYENFWRGFGASNRNQDVKDRLPGGVDG